MKAILFRQHGGPEVLQYADVPDPEPRPNEVLVRVRACALNHLDLWVRGGLPNVPIPLPHIPGSDVAGEIVKIGSEVTTVRVGQNVVLAPGVTCGKCAACISGQDNRCRQFTNLGYMARSELPPVSRESVIRRSRRRPARLSNRLAHAHRPR